MSRWRLYLAFVIALAVVGVISSRVRLPDNLFYIQASERMINPGCAEIHCFRVLVPWTIGAIPGNWLFKWKAYAVLANAGAALAVFDLCLFFGLTRRASIVAGALSAFGFSSFGTIWQPYQSDPLMFWWAPIVMRWALEDRMAAAGMLASVGVFAKEFIVVPLGIAGIADAMDGRAQQQFTQGYAVGDDVEWRLVEQVVVFEKIDFGRGRGIAGPHRIRDRPGPGVPEFRIDLQVAYAMHAKQA